MMIIQITEVLFGGGGGGKGAWQECRARRGVGRKSVK